MKSPIVIASSRDIKDYNTPQNMGEETNKYAKAEYWQYAKPIGEKLAQIYPGREWSVQVDLDGGIIIIKCPSLSLDRGFILKIPGQTIKTLTHKAVFAAGEILERFNVSRNRKFDSDILEALPRDFRDEAISSDAIPESFAKGLKGGHGQY